MGVKDILKYGGAGLAALMTVIQISPLKVDPWTFILKLLRKGLEVIGRAFNRDMLDKMNHLEEEVTSVKTSVKEDVAELRDKVDGLSAAAEEQAAINSRARILRFGDEVLHGLQHSKDHFDSVLRDARAYENYCDTHPKFENGVTEPTINRIKEVYADRLSKNDFL